MNPFKTAFLGTLLPGLASVGLFVALPLFIEAQEPAPPARPVTAPVALEPGEVLHSVTNQYPPMLAALIERDLAAGRLQSARGAMDFTVFSRLFGTPQGYYESGTWDSGFEQFTGLWGSTVFGGYRLTRGDRLPDYDSSRTQNAGEARLGFRLPLLRDGSIDRRRANLLKAGLDQQLAEPLVQRQRLDFIRAGTVAYFNWLAAGMRERVAGDLLRVARDRTTALTQQVEAGLIPRLVLTDNRRLVVARELGGVQAQRRFEAATLALSLFLRDTNDVPVIVGRGRLPAGFPEIPPPDESRLAADRMAAETRRPELARLRLQAEKLQVDRRLAQNQLLPNLDAGLTGSQDLGRDTYKDKGQFEVQAGLELRVPLQRREAKGRIAELAGQLEQVGNEQRFARDRIRTEVNDVFSAWNAAYEQSLRTRLNVELARELEAAEQERFSQGATDLLALQIREQAAFDAEVLALEAAFDCFRAQADYRAAVALDLP
jgi:outer membrane protein TolC